MLRDLKYCLKLDWPHAIGRSAVALYLIDDGACRPRLYSLRLLVSAVTLLE